MDVPCLFPNAIPIRVPEDPGSNTILHWKRINSLLKVRSNLKNNLHKL